MAAGTRIGWLRAAAAAGLLLAARPAPLGACSLIPLWWVRDPAGPALVLQALPDSAYVGNFIPRRYDPDTFEATADSARERRVYAQVFRVRQVVARGQGLPRGVRRGARVVVVDWDLSASCGALAPRQARFVPPGHLAFVRPATRSVGAGAEGVWMAQGARSRRPVLEISPWQGAYAPWYFRHRGTRSWIRRLFRPRPMTVQEYARMYAAMPAREQWLRDPDAAARRVTRWAEANRRLVRREPARRMLQYLPHTVDQMQRQAEEASAARRRRRNR
ncbi:MAG: hypothetical protein KY467_12420 [Gemmatimonadetes bacterium]|nr:hypothetical protein [Gemmatimonadota bacterium]